MLKDVDIPLSAADPAADERAYVEATSHSVRVRRLRIALPLAALSIAAVFTAVSIARTWLPEDLRVESASIENGKLVMQKPAIAGRNDEGISYSMKAERALQDVSQPDIITLENIRAMMPVNDEIVATVDAASGVFDRGTNRLDMREPFTISLNNGLTASFQSAFLDVAAGLMRTEKAVAIKTGDVSIVAERLEMTDKGRVVIFEGRVRVVVEPAALRKNQKRD